jgi:hypothetical protein
LNRIEPDKVIATRNPATEDAGKVRMGYISPAFPPLRAPPASVADNGRVRTGYISPAFPPRRSR